MKTFGIFIFIILLSSITYSQNSAVPAASPTNTNTIPSNSNAVKLTGSISLQNNYIYNPILYPLKGYINNTALATNGNIRISRNFNIGFSGNYNNRVGFTYNDPFQKLGVTSNYKWLKVHLGHRNVLLSPLSMNGVTFLGAGIELNPKKFRFALVYGDFKPFTIKDKNNGYLDSIDLKVKRMGYAGKIGLGTNNNFVDFVVLKVEDHVKQSLTDKEILRRAPVENLVTGLNSKFSFFHKKVTLTTEIMGSAFSKNTLVSEVSESTNTKIPKEVNFLFTPRLSSEANYAGQSTLAYTSDKFKTSVTYRRIMPEFKSLGTNFRGGDIENINANVSANLMNGKLAIMVMGSKFKNNLLKTKSSTSESFMGITNIIFSPVQYFGLNVGYTYFNNTMTNLRNANNDTFNINQNTHTLFLTPTLYLNRDKNYLHTISYNNNLLLVKDLNSFTAKLVNNQNIQHNITYSIFNNENKRNYFTAINFGKQASKYYNQKNIGFTLGANIPLLNNRMISNSTYNFNTSNDFYAKKYISGTHIIRTNWNYYLTKKHIFNVVLAYQMTTAIRNIGVVLGKEIVANVGYVYKF